MWACNARNDFWSHLSVFSTLCLSASWCLTFWPWLALIVACESPGLDSWGPSFIHSTHWPGPWLWSSPHLSIPSKPSSAAWTEKGMLWDCNDGPQDADGQKGVQILAGRGHWLSGQEKLEYLLDCPPVRTAFSTVCWLAWPLAFYLTVLFKVSRVQLRFFPLQLFHGDSAPGLGKGSRYPALIKVLSHPAQRLLPASPERTAGLCFRPFCMSGACHPSPGRGAPRDR